MIEQIAAASGRDVSRGTFRKLEWFADLLAQENSRQNLIALSSVGELWTRHLLDGAQLLGAADRQGTWLDIGNVI